MDLKTLCLTAGAIFLLSLSGCVAKSDYLQKTAEADALSRNLAAMSADSEALRHRIAGLTAERDRLAAERQALSRRNRELDTRLIAQSQEQARTLETLRIRIAELEGDRQMLQESIDLLRKRRVEEVQTVSQTYETLLTEREEEVRVVSKTYESLLTQMKEEIEDGQIKITELKGKLTVDVVDKILFDSGQAEIKQTGLEVLKRVVEILLTVTDKTIRVEGHTDNVPIGGNLAKRYPTNWELSAARALNVTRYLEEAGIDPLLLSAAAYGEHQPVADNETPEGRSKNRRIAIILLPKE